MKSTSILAGSLVAASQVLGGFAISPDRIHVVPNKVARAGPTQSPSSIPKLNTPVSVGCYTTHGNMTVVPVKEGLSSGSCREACLDEDYTLSALQGQLCLCGLAMPPADTLVKDKNCNYACPGYGEEACGGIGNPKHYSVWNLGVNIDPPTYEEEEEEEESATTTAPAATNTAPKDEPEETESGNPDSGEADGEDDKEKTNVAGIVAGSVVGVVAVAAAAGGLWFFMRRRRNTEIEEEHRRNAAVNAFISGSKPPGSSGSISMTDSRLDPVMAHRRLSDGSIADNEDYSRKILRVTNA
ncbi:Cell wall integrity and stress response component-like protein [Hapsidospora chrysogenum ATCC 11550]|uniref:Cell wall integrity and stress response component-like protein n=1 Tax=Hapsidospora chrysogenum (strain ATCC 11550 / CBS 779.69 / DSM 880 / IAM 14645 / JCM 23072 / IMI 49137) TaxID=857340 RepID=A0A086TFZ8_HAPC1|nr:Cell wall integrity and stress response component-like protein [Hapsidospora chrysogenum ATCC 11550]